MGEGKRVKMRWLRWRSRRYKTVPRQDEAALLDVGGRIIRARSRTIGDRRRCERESGIADFEAVLGAFGAQAAQGKRMNLRELEQALKPQMEKVKECEDRL